jgi:tetratricopeptide (TPR) repeat protein
VNVKVFGIMAVSLAVLAGAVFSLHAYQMQRNAGILLRHAEQAENEGHLDDAIRYYQIYLKYSPDDLKTRVAFAEALDKKLDKSYRDERKVFDLYESVLRLQPDNHEVRLKLVDAAIAAKRYADALRDLEILLNGHYAGNGEVERRAALCHASRREPGPATEYYRKAIEHAPQLRASYVELADLYLQSNNRAEADKVMADLIARNPQDYQAYIDRAHYFQKGGLTNEAFQETQVAFRLAPEKSDTILAMAEVAEARKRWAEARQLLAKGLAAFPDHAAFYLVLARVEMSDKHADTAIACLRRGIGAVAPRSRSALLHQLGVYLIRSGQQDQVADVVRDLEKLRAPAAVVSDLRGQLLIAGGKWSEAAILLEKLRGQVAADPDAAAQVDLLLGRCYEKLAEPDQALTAYRHALANQAGLLEAQLGAAAALADLKKFDEAIREYQALLPREPTVGPLLARLLVLDNLRRDPANQDWKRVEEVLQTAARDNPQSADVPLVRAQMLMAQNRADKAAQARAVLEEACKEHPDNVDLWLALADTEELRGNFAEGLAILQRAEDRHLGDRIEVRLARARYWARRRSADSAELAAALAALEQNLEKFKPADQARLLRDLGEIHYRAGHGQEAQRLWLRVASLQPQDLPIRLALFDLALQTGDNKEAEQLVSAIRDLEGRDGTLWRFAQASLIVASAQRGKKEDLRLARQLFNEVAVKRGSWAPTVRGLATLDDLEGNKQEALKGFARAFDLGDRDPDALRRAIQLMYDRRQFEDADHLLKKLQEQGKLPLELLAMQASLRSQQGQHENAIALARKAITEGSKTPQDYVWLGQILWVAGEKYHKEAEEAFRTATHLPGAEKLSDPWVALVQFFVGTRQMQKAVDLVDEAKRRLPQPAAALALAQCCEAIGRYDAAGDYFDQAARANPADYDTLRNVATYHFRRRQLARAAPYFARLLDPAVKAEKVDKMWAACFLAICDAHAGDFQSFAAARRLLQQYMDASGGVSDSQRLMALLLAAHPHTRRDAIGILEDLRSRGLLAPEERLTLGQLYEATDDWPRARAIYASQASAELESASKELPRVTDYVLALLRHGQKEEAGNWLQPLRQRAPDALQTVELQIRLLKLQGRTRDAETLIKQYEQQPRRDLPGLAALYEEVGRASSAEDIYRTLLKEHPGPQGLLTLAEFLGRQGRIDEALDLCAQAAPAALNQAASLAMAVLQASAKPAPLQMERVDKLLNDALLKSPGSPALLMHLAALRNLQGNYAETEAVYRQILERQGRDVTVMNNLAFLLAFRSDQTEEARTLINRAIDMAGPLPELLDTRALVYLRLGLRTQALADLDTAIQDAPSASLYFHRALALLASDRAAAADSLKKARALQLARANLHPLEQPGYDQLVADLHAN